MTTNAPKTATTTAKRDAAQTRPTSGESSDSLSTNSRVHTTGLLPPERLKIIAEDDGIQLQVFDRYR